METTDTVRKTYAQGVMEGSMSSDPEACAEFDAWLAEHDRQVAERAYVRGASDMLDNGTSEPRNLSNPYARGVAE